MKKILVILLALAAFLPASADRYLTFGENDTLMVRPSREDGTQAVMVRAHFDGRLDQWSMIMNLPQGVRLIGYERSDDMLYVPYWNNLGESCYCSAPLYVNQSDDGAAVTMRTNISQRGYWDPYNNGRFDNYGTVKWEAGDYDRMFELVFRFEDTLPDNASIAISEYLSSNDDQRGFTIPATYLDNTIQLYWVYRPGDVDGDAKVGITDVTALIDMILSGEVPQSEDLRDAADVDGDGTITIVDVTVLIDRILTAA